MWILWLIIGGLIIGAIARLVVPGRNPIGILMTILLGIVGALAGGFIAHAIGAGALIQSILAVVVAASTGHEGDQHRRDDDGEDELDQRSQAQCGHALRVALGEPC